jgi:carbon monoxide dehydrogenase subunit G
VQQQGEYRIGAEIQAVWQALNDPEVLRASIPGCESIEQIDEANLQASVRAKVGPVNAVFKAAIALSDVQEPHSYTLSGEVKGGAGVAKGEARVQLAEVSDEGQTAATLLTYQVQASVGGKLAQIGSRLVDGAAAKMADDFFAAFSNTFATGISMQDEQSWEAPSGQQAPTDADKPAAESPQERAQDGLGFIWVTAFVVLITAMVLAL